MSNRFRKTSVFVLALLLSVSQMAGTIGYGEGSVIESTDLNPNPAQNVVLANASGVLNLNLDEYEIGEYQEFIMEFESGVLYNFSAQGTGQGTFEIAVLNEFVETSYQTQETTVGYSDEILQMAGVPLFGNYDDSWNVVEYLGIFYDGIAISVGLQKDFLLYIDPALDDAYRSLTWVVILTGTADPLNNSLVLDWEEIDLGTAADIVQSDSESGFEAILAPESFTPVNLITEGGQDLTDKILNQTTMTNGSALMVNWNYDLSGNLVRETVDIPGVLDVNEIFVPQFNNLLLDGTPSFAVLINPNLINDVNFSLAYAETADQTYQYETVGFNSSVADFEVGEGNIAWKVLELPDPAYFDITIGNSSDQDGGYWDVSATFYSIGTSETPLFNLNSAGVNETETAAIFTVGQNSDFLDTVSSAQKATFDARNLWWGEYGLDNPEILDSPSSQFLGIKVTSQSTLATTNYSCPITISPREIAPYTDGTPYELGSENGFAYDDADIFHVRSFPISNFSQYKWMMQSDSAPDLVEWKLYCRGVNTYEINMNNGLISDSFDSTSLSGAISLSFDLSGELRNDELYVYIRNSTTQSELASFTATQLPNTYSYDVSAWNDSEMEIIFNMSSDDKQGLASGPVIDNVKVSNGTDDAFFDDFSIEHDFMWSQVDNNGGDLMLWHIEADNQDFNQPAVEIVYPNKIYTFNGYLANPYVYSEFTKTALAYNPLIQSSSAAYLIIKPAETALIHNLTATLNIQEFEPIKLEEGGKIEANQTYNQLVFEDNEYQEEIIEYNGFYEYFYLDIAQDSEYILEFQTGREDAVLFYSTLLDEKAQTGEVDIEDHFGFFVANHTYGLEAGPARKIYIQFDAIEAGFEIDVKLEKIEYPEEVDPARPWKLATAILAGAAAIPIAFILYDKRALFKSKKKVSKDKQSASKTLADNLSEDAAQTPAEVSSDVPLETPTDTSES